MRRTTLVALLAATACFAQEPVQPRATTSPQDSPAVAQSATISVPTGTRIPVKLTYSLSSKTARVGDTVHVVTVFPVTVDTIVAIPSGTYLEGVIDRVTKRPVRGRPAFQMHFTQLLFANGYTVDVESAATEARKERAPQLETVAAMPADNWGKQLWMTERGVIGASFAAQQQPPPLTPPPHPGPNIGTVAGIGAAVTVAAIVATVLLNRNRGGYAFLDEGSPLELVLQKPLTLDAAQVASAVSASTAP